MPCSDGGWNDEVRVSKEDVQEHNMLEASMCGILTAIEKWGNDTTPEGRLKMLLDKVDWTEAGVKRKTLEMWWRKHKRLDEERRAREAAKRHEEELRASALAKLTLAERAALKL